MSLPSTWQELIMLFGALQGIILVIALSTRVKRKSPANSLLIWFILSLVFLLYAGAPAKNEFMQAVKHKAGFIGDTVAFLYGPLLFLYTSRLLFNTPGKKEWLHFIPALLFFPTNIAVQWIGLDELGEAFESVFFAAFGIVALLQFYIYIFLSFRLIKNYKAGITRELSYAPPVNYLLTIIGFLSICLTFFLIDFVGAVMGVRLPFSFIDYRLAWTLISMLTFILAYYAIVSPEIFRLNMATKTPSTIDLIELQDIKSRLLDKMENQKLYLDPNLSLQTLAERLDIRKELLSKVINQGLSKNFYRFVNEYRVDEFKRLMGDAASSHLTHLGLAYEAGFKSKTTFYKAFKEITGTTPAQFLKAS